MKRVFSGVGGIDWNARHEVNPIAYCYEKGRPDAARTHLIPVDRWEESDVVVLPMSLGYYARLGRQGEVRKWIDEAGVAGKSVVIYNGGDVAVRLPYFPHVLELRASGYRSRLNPNQRSFPFVLSDQLRAFYQRAEPFTRERTPRPGVGFCGQASRDWSRLAKDVLLWTHRNARVWTGLDDQEPEPWYMSAWHRGEVLETFERSNQVDSRFIKRRQYRGGARSDAERDRTSREYFDNMIASDYIVCIRGGGNFSLRLYETLMMGRIPILIDTDCILPFDNLVDWKRHLVWVDYHDRQRAPAIVRAFHDRLTAEDFLELQASNRRLWKEYMNVERFLQYISEWAGGAASPSRILPVAPFAEPA